ncbi:MarR family winged helix-turn-helix transcriptional regulator [Fusibacter ferrireducens]|uniref:MarR family transcriptional regulator n=1 Tax=Fusibacter ferrireducens TaxID=2785058 RepID=A0ABR9ZWZ9_9FIRM|nr:MarR family transcriptional regulator [Fusibacter ferrireducens]MBF4694979.1 MarR family transcriptional regulator [Fusibacter ferrireducens]
MSILEECAASLITLLPAIWQRYRGIYNGIEMPRQQLGLLFKIAHESGQPVSYYSELMNIPKSNITVASNHLVKMGFVDRTFSESDRRLILLNITEKGTEAIKIYKRQIRESMMVQLSEYDESELKRMNELIEELKALMQKGK